MLHEYSANLRPFPPMKMRPSVQEEDKRLRSIFRQRPRLKLDADESLFQEGDRADDLYELSSGLLRIVNLLSDGRRVIRGFIHPGEMIGLSAQEQYPYSVEAVVPSTYWRCTRRDFERDIEATPALRPFLFRRLCAEMESVQEKLVLMISRSADERLAAFLVERMGRDSRQATAGMVITLPMNRQDVADYLGLSPETVSRSMTRLVMRGLVAAAGRQTIRILKPRALARIAAGDEERADGCMMPC